MKKTVPELIAAISPEEWAQVPVSILKLIEELVRRMDKLEQEMGQLKAENELLKEQLARNSGNSSQPPSKNPLTFKPNRKKPIRSLVEDLPEAIVLAAIGSATTRSRNVQIVSC